MNNFKKTATMKREKGTPFRWVLTDDETGVIMDVDRYQNDLVQRWEDIYTIVKVGA